MEKKSKLNPNAKEFKFNPNVKEFKFNPNVKEFKSNEEFIYLNNIRSVSKHTSSKYDKIIYIFGERHQPASVCKIYKEDQKNIKSSVNTSKILEYIPINLREYYYKYSKNIKNALMKRLKDIKKDRNLSDVEIFELSNEVWNDENSDWPARGKNIDINNFNRTFEIIYHQLSNNPSNKELEEFYDENSFKIKEKLIDYLSNLKVEHYLTVKNLKVKIDFKLKSINEKKIFDLIFPIILDEIKPLFPMIFKPNNVIDVDKFIEKVIDEEKKHIDFFLEIPYKEKKEECSKINSKSYNFTQFSRKYWKCFCPDKKDCFHRNIRFHYTDIRQSQNFFLFKLYNEVGSFDIKKIEDLFLTDEGKEYKKLKTLKDFLEYGLQQYSKFKLSKQQENIEYPEIKIKLLEFLFLYLEKNTAIKFLTYEVIINGINNVEIYKSIGANISNRLKFALISNMINYNVIFMDVYLISRVFRKFTPKTKNEYSESPKNIIIFVGDTHANNYRNILKSLDFKTEFIKSEEDGCIKFNTKELSFPLF